MSEDLICKSSKSAKIIENYYKLCLIKNVLDFVDDTRPSWDDVLGGLKIKRVSLDILLEDESILRLPSIKRIQNDFGVGLYEDYLVIYDVICACDYVPEEWEESDVVKFVELAIQFSREGKSFRFAFLPFRQLEFDYGSKDGLKDNVNYRYTSTIFEYFTDCVFKIGKRMSDIEYVVFEDEVKSSDIGSIIKSWLKFVVYKEWNSDVVRIIFSDGCVLEKKNPSKKSKAISWVERESLKT